MAYYNNEQAFFDGRLLLYQRNKNTKSASNQHKPLNWYMRIKIEGMAGKVINKSTRHSQYEEAYIYAVNEYQRIWDAVRLGGSIESWTFAKHWEDWFRRNVDSGNWRDERRRWHASYYNRYFSEYFTDKK
ncbi:MAG: site-specific integrase, partial [Paracoccaceae bacterium]|nr:site-specific integrase [Paracoccaceae bacterium]